MPDWGKAVAGIGAWRSNYFSVLSQGALSGPPQTLSKMVAKYKKNKKNKKKKKRGYHPFRASLLGRVLIFAGLEAATAPSAAPPPR